MLHSDSSMLSFDEFQDALEDVPVSNCLEPPFAEDHRSADMLTTDVLSKSAARSGLILVLPGTVRKFYTHTFLR